MKALPLRPREKLYQRGVESLSNQELLQIVIGSGSTEYGVSRIARRTVRLLQESFGSLTLDRLLAIPGVGRVKAGQILVVFELASRFPQLVLRQEIHGATEGLEYIKSHFGPLTGSLIYCIALDGANRALSVRTYNHKEPKVYTHLARDALGDHAAFVMVFIPLRSQLPSLRTLELSRQLLEALSLVAVGVRGVFVCSKDTLTRVDKEVVYE